MIRSFDASLHRLSFRFVLGMRVDATNYDEATRHILAWARSDSARYVCVATVHMVMEAYDSAPYKSIVNSADMVTSDGMPLVWALRLLGLKGASRVYGPDLTPAVLEAAAAQSVPVGFYGGTPQVLAQLRTVLMHRYPTLRIAFSYPPPFRPLTEEEDAEITQSILNSGARILFVGLGCPKQEKWMAEHRDRLKGVMLGVGAAFDFLAGQKPQAPRWMQRCGLEWLFRLASEPKRLWRRYLIHNPRFLCFFALQMLKLRKYPANHDFG